MQKNLLLLATAFAISICGTAQLRLPSVLSSGMVLQQNDSVTLWGWGYTLQPVNITTSWNNTVTKTIISNSGKWGTKVKTPSAGGPYTISINSSGREIVLNDVLIGEVWLCSGQSNMEWNYYNNPKSIKDELPGCYNKKIRFYQVPRAASDYPQDDIQAQWQVCDSNSLKAFSAVGYFFGKKLNNELGDIPIGLINASWGGTPAEVWTPAEVVYNDEALKKAAASLQEVPWGPVKPGVNYNGMIAPVNKYNIAGAIWYQGEANVGTHATYAKLLTSMINSWRKIWDKRFPFYYVQLAPFKYGNKNVCALLQEQQTEVMKLPKTGMIVITDLINTVTDIHPSNKKDVGNRLANWAISETYKQDVDAYKSPAYKSMQVSGDKIIITLTDADEGLMVKGNEIKGFYISAASENWLPAEAKIENNKIILWNKNIPNPAQVRFGFGNTLIGNVFSKQGLPLCPFRTDNWAVDQSSE